MTENKRFMVEFDTVRYFCVVDNQTERCVGRFDTMADAKGYLELYEFYIDLQKENEQLKSEIKDFQELLAGKEEELLKPIRLTSRVFGDGKSFNCTNIATAKDLYNTLSFYEQNINIEKNISKQYDQLIKQIITLQKDLKIIQEDLTKLKEIISCLSK